MVVQLSFFHAEQMLMKLLFENQKTYANLLLGLMPANYTHTRCVNPCQPVLISNGILLQRRSDWCLDKTRPAALKLWSCLIFKEQDHNAKIVSFYTTGRQKEIDGFNYDGFCSDCSNVSEVTVAYTTFVHFKKYVHTPLKKIFYVTRKRELDELRQSYLQWECEWWRLYNTTTNVKQTTYPGELPRQTIT